MSRLKAIKARQIEQAAETGINPYHSSAGAELSAPEKQEKPVGKDKGHLDHYQASMDADLGSLKELKTLAEKQAAKKTMIETYWAFVKDYLDSGHAYPNSIAVQLMIWLFDTLDIERALDLALHLIKQGIQQMPARFERRDLETFVCDAMYDWANDLLKKNQSASPYLDTLVAVLDNDNWSLSPPVKSKVYAMLAKHKNREGDWLNCVALCEKAEAANPEGAGVKGLKEAASKKLKPTE
jgi:hypothetical protein